MKITLPLKILEESKRESRGEERKRISRKKKKGTDNNDPRNWVGLEPRACANVAKN